MIDSPPQSASMLKYTTPLSCMGLSESVKNLYTKFEFCEGYTFEIHIDL